MSITPAMVGAAINLVFTERLIDAQREATNRLVPFAQRSVSKAKQLFSQQFTSLRNFDSSVYGYIQSLPNYRVDSNNIYRGQRTGHIAAANLVKSSAFGISRYNVGDREAAINAALASGLVRAGEIAADAGNFEDTLVAAYAQLKWTSLSNSSRPGSATPTRAFGDIANSIVRQAESIGSAAEKSVASLVYLGTSALLRRKNERLNTQNNNVGETATPLPSVPSNLPGTPL